MKIQSIDNQNISHKAYFKPNAEFKKIWILSEKNENVKNNLSKLANLENHELEIIESGRAFKDGTDYSVVDYYAIFNNFTKKALTFNTLAELNKNPLEIILNTILAKNHKMKDFFTKDEVSDIFEKFTTPKG